EALAVLETLLEARGLLLQLLVAELGEDVARLPHLPSDGLQPAHFPALAGAQDLVEEVDHSCSRRCVESSVRTARACPIVCACASHCVDLRRSSRRGVVHISDGV